ncbi:MAG: DUF4198 domain-containing protein [Rubrivivax sp.]|nr:DUF4198 domain-containing protein [Rubrivivax sp.]
MQHRHRPRLDCAALAALCALAAPFTDAAAHDSWLEPRAGAPAGHIELALTTGELFPAAETPIAAEALVEQRCTSRSGLKVPLQAGAIAGPALQLRARVPDNTVLASCQVQTTVFEVEVAGHLVPVYLREIAAPETVHAAWAAQRRRGLPWIERYTKHARTTFGSAAGNAPVPSEGRMALDIEIEAADGPRAGGLLAFRAWRDGRPLPGLAVELRGEASRFGLWRRTDAEGRASVIVPLPGRWVLRATDLRPLPEEEATSSRSPRWESRFVTHTFVAAEALPAAAARLEPPNKPPNQPPNAASPTSSPNARSANHASASNAMSPEPPTSTARR